MNDDFFFFQEFWMTGTPVAKSHGHGCLLAQNVPWHLPILGASVYCMVLWGISMTEIPELWFKGFILFGVVVLLLAFTHLIWLVLQPAIVIFDADTDSIAIPRLRLTMESSDLVRFQLVAGTCSDGEGGRYPVVALRLFPDSVVYVTNRHRELRNAWTTFMSAVKTQSAGVPDATEK